MKLIKAHIPLTLFLMGCNNLLAEVIIDASLNGSQQQLVGPNYQISPDLGQTKGNNLFYSFSAFNLNNTESANFSGPSNINNIFSRVTGGSFSSINGTISSNITGANLWLINPNGIVFGKDARIDVRGSFHATTADYIQFDNEQRFYSNPDADNSILSTANPSAFGFTNENPVGIAIDSTQFELPEEQTLSLVGGPITLTNAKLRISAGRINIAAVGSAGSVAINSEPSATERGINLSEGIQRESINLVETTLDSSAGSGGRIFLVGGEIYIDSTSRMENNQTLANDAARIDIDADDVVIDGAQITMRNSSDGVGGSFQLRAENLRILNNNETQEDSLPQILSATNNSGQGADITIEVENTFELIGGQIVASAINNGAGGDINIKAREFIMNNGKLMTTANDSSSTGQIAMDAGSIRLSNDSFISSTTQDGDSLGISFLTEGELIASGKVSITTETTGAGKGGEIAAETGSIDLSGNTTISTRASGTGDAGNISLCAINGFSIDSVMISSDADTSSGGDIELASNNTINLNKSNILTSGAAGGNVSVNACDKNNNLANKPEDKGNTLNYIIQNDTIIASQVASDGKVTIDADRIFQSLKSSISGTGGVAVLANNTISKPPEIESEETTVLTLPVIFTLPTFVNTPCANTSMKYVSSFVMKSNSPLAHTPGDWYSSSTKIMPKQTNPIADPNTIASLDTQTVECYL